MRKSFILQLLLILVKNALSGNCYGHDIDNIKYETVVVKVDDSCSPRTLSNTNDPFNAADVTQISVIVAAGLTPQGWAIAASFSLIKSLTATDEAQRALDELYNELIRCVDAKLIDFRSTIGDQIWRGYMSRFSDAMNQLNDGVTFTEVAGDVDDLFDQMNGQIVTDFGSLQSEDQYLTAEALLPLAKKAAEAYWLTFTMRLNHIKQLIESGSLIENDYNSALDLGREKLEILKAWCNNAINVVSTMYYPTTVYTDVSTAWTWKIKWEKGARKAKGDQCSFGLPKNVCESCFKSRIVDEFHTFIDELTSEYVAIVDIISRNSYLIGKYGQMSYHQVTSSGGWYHCDNLGWSSNDIISTIKQCNNDNNCIGFSWSDGFNWDDELDRSLLKKDGDCAVNGVGSGYQYSSVFKATSVLCYEQLFTAKYPFCGNEAPALARTCQFNSQYEFAKTCDNNADCIGYYFDPNIEYGCFRTAAGCTSHGLVEPSKYNYYSKCSQLGIEFALNSRGPPAPVSFVLVSVPKGYCRYTVYIEGIGDYVTSIPCDECLYDWNQKLSVVECAKGGSAMNWKYDFETRQIKGYNGECLAYYLSAGKAVTWECHEGYDMQWLYYPDTQQMKSVYNDKCMEKGWDVIWINQCSGSENQKWQFNIGSYNGDLEAPLRDLEFEYRSRFMWCGFIVVCCLCGWIMLCIKRIVGVNKKGYLKYDGVAMTEDQKCMESDSDGVSKF